MDNGGEYLFTEFQSHLKEKGIKHQLSVPNSPPPPQLPPSPTEQRVNRILMASTLSMIAPKGSSNYFWAEVISKATHARDHKPLAPLKDNEKHPKPIGSTRSFSFYLLCFLFFLHLNHTALKSSVRKRITYDIRIPGLWREFITQLKRLVCQSTVVRIILFYIHDIAAKFYSVSLNYELYEGQKLTNSLTGLLLRGKYRLLHRRQMLRFMKSKTSHSLCQRQSRCLYHCRSQCLPLCHCLTVTVLVTSALPTTISVSVTVTVTVSIYVSVSVTVLVSVSVTVSFNVSLW